MSVDIKYAHRIYNWLKRQPMFQKHENKDFLINGIYTNSVTFTGDALHVLWNSNRDCPAFRRKIEYIKHVESTEFIRAVYNLPSRIIINLK